MRTVFTRIKIIFCRHRRELNMTLIKKRSFSVFYCTLFKDVNKIVEIYIVPGEI